MASDWDASCVSLLPGPWCQAYLPPGLWFEPKTELLTRLLETQGRGSDGTNDAPDLGIAQDPRFPYWPGRSLRNLE